MILQDVSWGGQMRVMETYDKQNGCDLVCFGEVVARDPFLLMGRMPKPDFALAAGRLQDLPLRCVSFPTR